MADREGLAAAKRRYKVLKRCDQNDSEIKTEISTLETQFPELLGMPPPTLSKETRATLEGGALVTAIENGSTDTSDKKEVDEETAKKEEDVRKKLEELKNMAAKIQNEMKNNNIDEISNKEETEQKPTSVSSTSSPFAKIFFALRLYDAYHTFLPTQVTPDGLETASTCFFAALMCVAQFVTQINSLCNNVAVFLLNPIVWAIPVILFRTFKLEARNNKNDDRDVIKLAILFGVGPLVRFVLLAIVSFTIYTITFLVLQGVAGLQTPRRFCCFATSLLASGVTAVFAAPELRKADQRATFASDVYALGIVACEIITGEDYHHESLSPENFGGNEPLLNLIKRCIARDPSTRPKAATVADTLRNEILPVIDKDFAEDPQDELTSAVLSFRKKMKKIGSPVKP